MTRNVFVTIFFFSFSVIHAQYTFVKQWDKRLGGTKAESSAYLVNSGDGGFLIAGYSYSGIGGDKTQPGWGYSDYYAIKIDSAGNLVWEKRFGGLSYDGLFALLHTSDNGYVLGGFTTSDANGDKTEPTRGGDDYWIVKVDAAGNKQWDKRFGGTGEDLLDAGIIQTKDGGYLLGGSSLSGIGGDKTQPNWGIYDYWVVKIDSLGNKLWDRRYGGVGLESLEDLIQTADGGYLLGGTSTSDSSGDKSQHRWGNVSIWEDWWVVKIDSAGNKQWDKTLGTVKPDFLLKVMQLPDSNYLLVGGAGDTISGDKTTAKAGMWMVKINSTGAITWQASYNTGGGVDALSFTNDGGYLISGIASRDDLLAYPPEDRTENCLGRANILVLKLDSNFQKQWDKTIFTTGEDYTGYAVQTTDGCYAAATCSDAGIGGYKTQAAWDSSYDYFIVKFCMEPFNGIDNGQQTADNRQIQVYPNPFSRDLSIALKGENIHEATFTITNALGQVIYSKDETNLATGYTKILDLSYLPNGVYFVSVSTGGAVTTKKVVKE